MLGNCTGNIRTLQIPAAQMFRMRANKANALQKSLETLIQKNSTHLRELVLYDCSDHVSMHIYSVEALLRTATFYCSGIESLYSESPSIQLEALAAFLSSAKSLKKLNLPNADWFRRELVVHMRPGSLSSLEELHISHASAEHIVEGSAVHCPFITAALTNLPSLRKVVVSAWMEKSVKCLFPRESAVEIEVENDDGVEMEAATSSDSDSDSDFIEEGNSIGSQEAENWASDSMSHTDEEDSGETVSDDEEELQEGSEDAPRTTHRGRLREVWKYLRGRLLGW